FWPRDFLGVWLVVMRHYHRWRGGGPAGGGGAAAKAARAASFHAQLLQLVAQGAEGDAQLRRGPGFVPAVVFQRLLHRRPLQLLNVRGQGAAGRLGRAGRGRDGGGYGRGRGRGDGAHRRLRQVQVGHVDALALGQRQGALEYVLQLAHVAWEGIAGQRRQRRLGQLRRLPALAGGQPRQDRTGQLRQV